MNCAFKTMNFALQMMNFALKTNGDGYTFSAGKATLADFEARVFGYGHFAQMMPTCAPLSRV